MADEKPKETLGALSDYFKSLASKTPTLGEGTKVLMGGERDPELDELIKLLTEKGTTIKNAAQLNEFLKALGGTLPDAAQRRAAETNEVESGLANAWFDQHWPQPRRCPVCMHTNWAMAPTFAHIPMSLLGRHSPVRSFPCVAVTCQTCGNQLFFNAVLMNLLPGGAE